MRDIKILLTDEMFIIISVTFY
ncbi:Protein CBG25516 [Caenorhabditis briggsae]|uniref:Protein CBG25516 n=1 Tax=Caenorhabditis briggsae TaxID=6238 RepID=B6IFP1_CAEBR|nr:Protein CBG25516 [Caenorhabditis briggsae]CAR98721.1 Protein CBG25516 [Caenorhabditis briggsae]